MRIKVGAMGVTIYESEEYLAAQAAFGELRFADAERIVRDLLNVVTDTRSREILYDLLFFVYSNPLNEQLDKAQSCLEQKELIRQSAQNAMQWTQFMLFCKSFHAEAAKWADIAISRSEQTSDVYTLYTATAFRGLIAAKDNDRATVRRMLARITALAIGKDLPFGDEVLFLEAASALGEDVQEDARGVSSLIAPKIQDPEYRLRALRLGAPG
jgi:hypothetical protein